MKPDAQAPAATPPGRAAWPGVLLALYAVGSGLAAWLDLSWNPAGWACYTRPLLGTFGVLGGLLLLTGNPAWKPLLLTWSSAQSLILIFDPSGELTRQPGPHSLVNGVSLGFADGLRDLWMGCGVDLLGLGLVALVLGVVSGGWHPPFDRERPNRLGLALREVALVWATLLVLVGGWMGVKPLMGRDAVLVIRCQLPGTPVYLDNQWAGLAPVYLARDQANRWGISSYEGTNRVELLNAGADGGWVVAGDLKAALVGFRAPWFCRSHFQEMATLTGPRTMTLWEAGLGGKPGTFVLASKHRAGLVLNCPTLEPLECEPNGLLAIPLELRLNPPDRGTPTGRWASLSGSNAWLRIVFTKTDPRLPLGRTSAGATNVILPESWRKLSAGNLVSYTTQVKAPPTPGRYQISCAYTLAANPSEPSLVPIRQARCLVAADVR